MVKGDRIRFHYVYGRYLRDQIQVRLRVRLRVSFSGRVG